MTLSQQSAFLYSSFSARFGPGNKGSSCPAAVNRFCAILHFSNRSETSCAFLTACSPFTESQIEAARILHSCQARSRGRSRVCVEGFLPGTNDRFPRPCGSVSRASPAADDAGAKRGKTTARSITATHREPTGCALAEPSQMAEAAAIRRHSIVLASVQASIRCRNLPDALNVQGQFPRGHARLVCPDVA